MDRRGLLSSGALMGLGAVAGCATEGVAASDARTLFKVPQPMLPVVGTSEMFPVRRIYCIGRNYAAHAREMGSDHRQDAYGCQGTGRVRSETVVSTGAADECAPGRPR